MVADIVMILVVTYVSARLGWRSVRCFLLATRWWPMHTGTAAERISLLVSGTLSGLSALAFVVLRLLPDEYPAFVVMGVLAACLVDWALATYWNRTDRRQASSIPS